VDWTVDSLPGSRPVSVIPERERVPESLSAALPDSAVLVQLYRRMVVGRRFDSQATTAAKQGGLAVYPASTGQEACQVGAVSAMGELDWLFPTYRDSVALLTRGVAPGEILTLFRGEWHSGYDARKVRVAPQCTPLATHLPHAVGFAFAARRKGEPVAALVLLGDGATSEGDAHEAFNLAAVWKVPVVFLIQNNGFAISVPNEKQFAVASLARRGVGYGIPAELVDGNDVAAVHTMVSEALSAARSGAGPHIIEARTYRVGPHTNADDPTRYRDEAELRSWERRDPVARLERYLEAEGLLEDGIRAEVSQAADRVADEVRSATRTVLAIDRRSLVEHVYATPHAALRGQLDWLGGQ
jgi:2-oxoisovalerate dehydrogenase E1 component alpha subunit